MNASSKPDGDAIDPRIARVLLFHREAVAQATERAYRDLRAAGVNDADAVAYLVGPVSRRPTPA